MQAVQREHDEQAALIRWADRISRCRVDGQGPFPELAFLFAIPNGGWRLRHVAAQMKREGVRAGVPDLCLPVASPAVRCAETSREGFAGFTYGTLWIEMKTATGRLSKVQQTWRDFLTSHGQAHVLCRSAEEGRRALICYLAGDDPEGDPGRGPPADSEAYDPPRLPHFAQDAQTPCHSALGYSFATRAAVVGVRVRPEWP